MHLPPNNSGSLQPTKSRYERLSWYNWDANQQVFNRDLPKTVSITCGGQEIMMLALTSGRAPDFVLHCRLLNNDVEWESNPYHRTTCGSITRQRKNNWQYFDRPWAKPAPEPKPLLSTKPQQHVRISHPQPKKLYFRGAKICESPMWAWSTSWLASALKTPRCDFWESFPTRRFGFSF